MVTGVVVLQTVPRSVIALPPSAVIFPPSIAEVAVMVVAVGELITGAVADAAVAWLKGLLAPTAVQNTVPVPVPLYSHAWKY